MHNQHFRKSYNMDICRDSIFLEQSGKNLITILSTHKTTAWNYQILIILNRNFNSSKKKIMFAMQRLQQAKYNISVLKAFRSGNGNTLYE